MSTAFWYATSADALVVVHMVYVGFVVLGQLAILLGIARRWEWVRNLRFRLAHFTAIAVVALEAIFGIECPLTRWENQMRVAAGQYGASGSFIGRWVHSLLFYDCPDQVFTVTYVLFAVLVLVTLFAAPPLRKPQRG